MIAFPDIESMTIERFFQNFTASGGKKKYRKVVLGLWSIEIKEFVKYSTTNPENNELKHKIVRGQTHQRKRPENSRFTVGSENDSLSKRSITNWDGNWLGNTWAREYNNDVFRRPTLNQIEKGLISEAIIQVKLVMADVKQIEQILEAKANI